MKILPAIVFICIGIWFAYNYPEKAEQAYVYIDAAWQWIKFTFNRIFSGV